MFSIIFIGDLIQGHIQLLPKLGFMHHEGLLREKFHFGLQLCKSNFTQSEILHHCCTIANSFLDKIDIFATRDIRSK